MNIHIFFPLSRKPLIYALLFCFAEFAIADDAVTGMCIDSGLSDTECACSTKQVRANVPADQFKLYNEVATDYRKQLEQGKGMADAWDTAVEKAAQKRNSGSTAILQKTNAVGRAHSDAMKTCHK